MNSLRKFINVIKSATFFYYCYLQWCYLMQKTKVSFQTSFKMIVLVYCQCLIYKCTRMKSPFTVAQTLLRRVRIYPTISQRNQSPLREKIVIYAARYLFLPLPLKYTINGKEFCLCQNTSHLSKLNVNNVLFTRWFFPRDI